MMLCWTRELVQQRLVRAECPAEIAGWLTWLDPIDLEIVRARTAGCPWKLICWRFSISRVTAYRHWRHALGLIAWRLNGNALPARCSRRRFIRLAAAQM